MIQAFVIPEEARKITWLLDIVRVLSNKCTIAIQTNEPHVFSVYLQRVIVVDFI
jgi:hypothetical protein